MRQRNLPLILRSGRFIFAMERNYRVYCYTNQITNQRYIGKTCFKYQSTRAGKNGKMYSGCSVFWNDIQIYGWPNFKYEVLEDGLTKEEAEIKEREYIEKFNTIYPFGLNLQSGGLKGRKNHSTTKEKLSQFQYGKTRSEEFKRKVSDSCMNHPDHSKRVQQFSKDGQIIAEYPSIMEAYRQTGINFRHISECTQGKRKSAGGFIWKAI